MSRRMAYRRMPHRIKEILMSHAGLFNREDDALWKEWLDFKPRNGSSLIELIKGDFRDSFKARAMFILLVPHQGWSPFHWEHETETSENYLYQSRNWIDKVPGHLVQLYAELVMAFSDAVAGSSAASEDDTFNRLLIDLLGRAPASRQEEVFRRIRLNDPTEFWEREQASGYKPLRELLQSPQIAERWKAEADEAMRGIISSELEGEKKPRHDYEAALSWYLNIVEWMVRKDELPYGRELLAAQIRFIISVADLAPTLEFSSWNVSTIYRLLEGEEYRELRHGFAQLVVLRHVENGRNFWVYNQETLQAAELMLDEWVEQDPELRERLMSLIAAGRIRLSVEASRKEAAQAAESALHDRMR